MAANTLAPSGFHEVRLWGASPPNFAWNTRAIPYNYGSNIAYGDPVYLTSSGTAALYVKSGTTIDGICYGVEYFDPNNPLSGGFHASWNQPSLTSSATVAIKVQTDPTMIFAVQGRGTAVTASVIGQNADIYSGTSGQPVSGSGISACALDPSTASTTATLPFRIWGIFGLTPGFGASQPFINANYVATNDNQWFAVSMNTQDLTTRTGQA